MLEMSKTLMFHMSSQSGHGDCAANLAVIMSYKLLQMIKQASLYCNLEGHHQTNICASLWTFLALAQTTVTVKMSMQLESS